MKVVSFVCIGKMSKTPPLYFSGIIEPPNRNITQNGTWKNVSNVYRCGLTGNLPRLSARRRSPGAPHRLTASRTRSATLRRSISGRKQRSLLPYGH